MKLHLIVTCLIKIKTILGSDLVEGYKQYTIRPGETISLDETLDKETKYVGIVAFYNRVGEDQPWKMLLSKKTA